VALLDAGGKVAERVRYDAYGNAMHHHGLDADGDRDADSSDAAAINALRGSWSGAQPLSIADAPYRAEYDLDRNGVINGSDALLAQSTAAAALPAGWISASGAAGGPDSIVGYGGYIFNRETMYYTVRHRHYSPALGRFLERDPAGYIDGSSLYLYARSNPVTILDPTGRFGLVGALVGAVVGGVVGGVGAAIAGEDWKVGALAGVAVGAAVGSGAAIVGAAFSEGAIGLGAALGTNALIGAAGGVTEPIVRNVLHELTTGDPDMLRALATVSRTEQAIGAVVGAAGGAAGNLLEGLLSLVARGTPGVHASMRESINALQTSLVASGLAPGDDLIIKIVAEIARGHAKGVGAQNARLTLMEVFIQAGIPISEEMLEEIMQAIAGDC